MRGYDTGSGTDVGELSAILEQNIRQSKIAIENPEGHADFIDYLEMLEELSEDMIQHGTEAPTDDHADANGVQIYFWDSTATSLVFISPTGLTSWLLLTGFELTRGEDAPNDDYAYDGIIQLYLREGEDRSLYYALNTQTAWTQFRVGSSLTGGTGINIEDDAVSIDVAELTTEVNETDDEDKQIDYENLKNTPDVSEELTGEQVRDKLVSLEDDERLPANKVRDFSTAFGELNDEEKQSVKDNIGVDAPDNETLELNDGNQIRVKEDSLEDRHVNSDMTANEKQEFREKIDAAQGGTGGFENTEDVGTSTAQDIDQNRTFYATGITLPEADDVTWILINVTLSTYHTGEWHRIELSDILDLDDATAALNWQSSAGDDHIIIGNVIANDELVFGKTSARELLIASYVSATAHYQDAVVNVKRIVSSGEAAGSTDITIERDEGSVTVVSSSGADAEIDAADADTAGVMTTEQFDKLAGIQAEATKNSAGDGIEIDTNGEITVDDEYIEDIAERVAEGEDIYLSHFRSAYTTQFDTQEGTRWTTEASGSAYRIRIRPSDANALIIEDLIEGDKIQVRGVVVLDADVLETFTLTGDSGDPDASGVYIPQGTWDAESPTSIFTQSHNYDLYFTQSVHELPQTDDETIEGNGRSDNKIRLKAEGVDDSHISDSMDEDAQEDFREKLGVILGDLHVAVDDETIEDDETDGLRAKEGGIDKQHLNTDIVDDATIEIDADDGLRVKEGGLNDLHVSGSLNNEQKVAYRQKLEADKVSSGDGITINEHDNAQRIAVTNPFTDEDETLLQEVASNSSGHLSGDELVLRSQYGSEHFFGDSRRAIVSIAHDGSDIFLADPTGRVNRKPTLVGDTAVYGLATNGMNWYVGSNHQHRIHVLHLNSSENFVSASPASTITVESKDLAIDVEDGTTLYQMRYDAGLQLRAYTISETEGNGQCDIQVTRTITTASINSLLNSHDVLSLGAIINTNQNVGVTAFSARDSYLYFAVSGVYRENRQSQTTAIIRASITGTGTNRDFTLDTDYIQLVNVLNGVNGLYPTEDGFWMARSYSALDFRLGEFNSTELDDMPDAPEAEDDGKALVYNHDDANYQLKHLRLPASFFWFQDQTVRLPIETIDNSHPDLAGNDVAILNGDDADEDFNGGIGTATTGNLDDESNADVRPDTDRTFIEIHTGGVFHIKVKVLAIASAQPAPTVVIRKIENNTDDALLLHNAGYAAGSAVANIATTFSEKEEYVSLSANDKIYIRFHNLNQARRAVGYIQIERVT